MNDLHTWLSQQHHGLRTFRTFQQKLETLGRDDPAQRGLCRLLSGLVGSYVEAFDEEPLPVEIADGAYQRLLTLVESIDLHGDANRRLLYRTYVAHGINSGEEFANSFSNKMESCKSSLGFYITKRTYSGINGMSLRIEGVDKGFNDNAAKRAIVIHGANYVSKRILNKYGVMGTTFGCPAIPSEMTSQIIPVVKNGSCFFIYYPSQKYLTRSAVLNS